MATWIRSVFFGIHYDLHARPSDKAFGAGLTPEHLRERLQQVRPDWIQCDGKGHPGYTSYPSKVGSTVPGLVGDPLRIHRDVTRELGIKLGVHYSGVWDYRGIELHPEWACRDAEGKPSNRVTCRNSGYLDELMIPQLLEMVEHYDVDGFWVDGDNWGSLPCWCERCVAEFTRRTGIGAAPRRPDEPQWAAWLAYHRDLFVEYVDRWTRAIHARKSECAVTSSYMYGARQPDPRMTVKLDYLSGDLDFRWGAEHALLEARTYDARRSCAPDPPGLPWNLMAWMHTKPGEMGDPRPWLLKPVVHLCQELSEALALGGAVMVYENPQRSGRLTAWHHEEIAEVAAFCRAREEVCFQSQTVPQVAVLHFAAPFYSRNVPLYQYEPGTDPVEGALHALTELHYSTDVLTEDAIAARLDEYPLAVLPEQHGLDSGFLARLRAYIERGGHVLITGAHAAAECPDLVGAAPQGPTIEQEVYLAVGDEAVRLAGAWQPVACGPSAQVIACRLTQQEPACDTTSEALVTRRSLGRGSVLAVHGPLFADYFNWPLPRVRTLIGGLIARFPIEWLVRVEGPPRLEVVLRRKDGRLLVHLLNRGPAVSVLPPKRILIEELPPLQRVMVHMRCKAQPASVFLAPSAQTVTWSYHAGALAVQVPRVDVHEVLVVECGGGA